MTLDMGVVDAAFQAGAGFSAAECRTFLLVLLSFFALVWGTVMIIGWQYGQADHKHPYEYFTMRIVALGFLLVMMTVVFYSPS